MFITNGIVETPMKAYTYEVKTHAYVSEEFINYNNK